MVEGHEEGRNQRWVSHCLTGTFHVFSLVWPVVGTLESELQASIWYVMALSSYRQNSMEENKIYCQLFLTSGRATKSNPATTSAWGMLAHTMICELFKLDEDQMFKQWEYRTMPYRVCPSFSSLMLLSRWVSISTRVSVSCTSSWPTRSIRRPPSSRGTWKG